jgi:hypothetical protein
VRHSDLTRIVCEYQRRPGHRFDAKTAPERVTVDADGRLFVVAPSVLLELRPNAAVWSCHTLATGSSRWAVRLEAGQPVWPGLADTREVRTSPSTGMMPKQVLYVGDCTEAPIFAYYKMDAVPKAARDDLTDLVVERSPPVLQFTYDDVARTLTVEIDGEPEAGAAVFKELPAAEFLCPIILIGSETQRWGCTVRMESQDE